METGRINGILAADHAIGAFNSDQHFVKLNIFHPAALILSLNPCRVLYAIFTVDPSHTTHRKDVMNDYILDIL